MMASHENKEYFDKICVSVMIVYRISFNDVCGFRFWANFLVVLRFWTIFSSVLRFLIQPNAPLLLLTKREGRTEENWPEVVPVRNEGSEVRKKTIDRPRVNISQCGSIKLG